MTCPKCGASDREVISVWEDDEREADGEESKFIGCKSCHRLLRRKFIEEYRRMDDMPSQALLNDYEIERLKPLGNQNTQRLTLIEWQCVKGAAAHYGVTDWTSKVDRTLTYEENVALMKRHGTRNSSRTMKQMPELQ